MKIFFPKESENESRSALDLASAQRLIDLGIEVSFESGVTQKIDIADQDLEENEQLQSDDQNSSLQSAKVAKRPTFIPDSSEEVDLEDGISSIPVLEGFEPIKGDE